ENAASRSATATDGAVFRHSELRNAASPLVPDAKQGFHLKIFFKAKDPELTPVAGLFIAAERQAAVESSTVEIDATGPDAVGDRAGARHVLGLHEARQTERRGIG